LAQRKKVVVSHGTRRKVGLFIAHLTIRRGRSGDTGGFM
jgi:hypothetical protein